MKKPDAARRNHDDCGNNNQPFQHNIFAFRRQLRDAGNGLKLRDFARLSRELCGGASVLASRTVAFQLAGSPAPL
jgi:hypothetical protein